MNRYLLLLCCSVLFHFISISAQGIDIYQMKATDEFRDTIISNFQQPISLDFKKTHIIFYIRSTSGADSLPYSYELIPFDTHVYTGAGNQMIHYINLPGGKYTFQVFNPGHREQKAEVTFFISKAFWQMDWFIPAILAYVLLLIGFIWFSIRTVKYRQQLRLQELRNKIASDLHDDIGGTLANISLLMSVAETKQDPLTVSGIHKRVQEDAKNTMLNMRGMLMAIHPGNDQAIDFFEKIRSSFSEALQMHHLESHFDFQLPDALKLTLDQQHHIFLLFKEIINNTLKHAEAHHLNSFVRLKNYWLMIQVTDDGRGFDPLVEHNGNGIRNIRSRVKAIHGTVEIVSGPGGTQYQIAIPMT